jgi:hypothetical protein
MSILGVTIYWLGPYQSEGEKIVENAIEKAELILQAPSDGFMKQIAKAESNYGKTKGTYDGSGGCGIWQVDKIALADTKDLESHPALAKAHIRIRRATGFDWFGVECRHLDYPLFGALAARMFLMNIPEDIPKSLKERAKYWKKYYNTNKGSGTVDDFLRRNNG